MAYEHTKTFGLYSPRIIVSCGLRKGYEEANVAPAVLAAVVNFRRKEAIWVIDRKKKISKWAPVLYLSASATAQAFVKYSKLSLSKSAAVISFRFPTMPGA